MIKSSSLSSILIFLFLCCLCLSDIPLFNPTRTQFYMAACLSQQRNKFVNEIDKYAQNYYAGNMTENLFQADPDRVFEALFAQNFSGLYQQLNRDSTSSWVNFIVLYIGTALMLILAPFLLACLCCPKCYKKKHKRQYSALAICCPNCITIVFSAAIIGLSIYLLLYSLTFREVYSDIKCSSALIFDDLINGNIDEDNSNFFRGLDYILKIKVCVSSFCIPELKDLTNQMIEEGNIILQDVGLLRKQIQLIPSENGSNLILEYQGPLLKSQKNYTIQSKIPTIIGSSENPQSIIGSLLQKTDKLQQQVKNQIKQATNFSNGLDLVSSFRITQFQQPTKSIKDANFRLQSVFRIIEDEGILRIVKGILYGILGAAVLFSFIAIILSCCNIRRRGTKCTIFVCIIIWLVGVIMFTLSIILSFVYPSLYYGCKKIEPLLSNQTAFKQQISNYYDSTQATNLFGDCLSKNNSSILKEYNFTQILTDFPSTLSKREQANNLNQSWNIQKIFTTNHQVLQNNRVSILMDIDDQAALEQITKISTSSLYNCPDSGLDSDSWVPNTQNTQIPCRINQMATKQCVNTAEFENKSPNCIGCISTTQIGILYKLNSNALKQGLDIRYPQCDKFNDNLYNLWDSYYLPKINTLDKIAVRFNQTSEAALSLQNKYNQKYIPTFNGFRQPNIQSIINPSTGFIAGSHCSVVGEDMRNTHRIVCGSGVQYMYFCRLMVIILAFLTLPMICCLSCSYYRSYFDGSQSSVSSKKKYMRAQTVQTDQIKHNYLGERTESDRNLKF